MWAEDRASNPDSESYYITPIFPSPLKKKKKNVSLTVFSKIGKHQYNPWIKLPSLFNVKLSVPYSLSHKIPGVCMDYTSILFKITFEVKRFVQIILKRKTIWNGKQFIDTRHFWRATRDNMSLNGYLVVVFYGFYIRFRFNEIRNSWELNLFP